MKLLFLALFSFLAAFSDAESKIKILENSKIENSDSIEVRFQFNVQVPPQFTSLPDKASTLNSYRALFPGLERLDGESVVFIFTERFAQTIDEATIKNYFITKYNNYANGLNAIQLPTIDWINGQVWDGTQWQCDH
jgi:hypothetical protein